MNAILGWSELLLTVRPSAAELAEGLDVIRRNARVQARLIEDLLDMSRIVSGTLRLDVQRVELAATIAAAVEVVHLAAEAKGVRLEILVDPVAGPVSGDPGRVQQMIWNLLSNAIKFTPRGGKVQVTVERVQSHIELSVSDTGEGIDPDYLPHVFERFSQGERPLAKHQKGAGTGTGDRQEPRGIARRHRQGQERRAGEGVDLHHLAARLGGAVADRRRSMPPPLRFHGGRGSALPRPGAAFTWSWWTTTRTR